MLRHLCFGFFRSVLIVAYVQTPSPSSRFFLKEGGGGVCTQGILIVFFLTIGHFSNEQGTGAEMRPPFVSEIVNGTRQSAIGHFSPVFSNSPRSLGQS